jgi:hypothetical protein
MISEDDLNLWFSHDLVTVKKTAAQEATRTAALELARQLLRNMPAGMDQRMAILRVRETLLLALNCIEFSY